MPRYFVTFTTTASAVVEVEAPTRADVEDYAWNVGPPSGPCHQEDFELSGDWEIAYVDGEDD